MSDTLNLGIAFIGGIVSFLSPCVVVLVPAFLAHLAGSSLTELSSSEKSAIVQAKKSIVSHTVLFIVGFSVVFIALGASLGFISQFIRDAQIWLQRIGGAVIILLGLVSLNVISIPWLQREHKFEVQKRTPHGSRVVKYFSSLIIGSAFAIGWTPCVGPVLAGILVLAGTSGSVHSGIMLLSAYTVGLMIPFLVTAFFTAGVSQFLSRHEKLLKWVHYIGGVLLILLGILVFTDNFARLIGALYFIEI